MSRSGWSWVIPQIEFAPGETLVEILNDDIATIRFDQPSYTASEAGANPNIGIISDVALPAGFTLTVSTEAGSAMAGEDYTALDNKEAFLPDEYTTGYIENVSVNNDLLIEFDETFEVVLSAPYGLPPGVELDPLQSRVPVKIESEDTALAGISETAAIDEDENATFNFRISHPQNLPVGQDVRVYYGVDEAATSATEGEDYTLPEMNYVTFSRSNATAQVTIPIINDKISEDNETLGLILLSSDHPDIEYMGAGRTITIRDDDQVTVGIIGEIARTVNEGDGSVAIGFGVTAGTLADDPSAAISVAYATAADTALEADDYTPVAGTVILTALNSRATIRIPIIDDAVPEGDEEFEFTITPGGNAIAGDTSADITITDDDPGTIGFALDYYEGREFRNDRAVPQVEVSPSLADTFTLNYVIEPGTATAGEDYTSMTMGTVELRPRIVFNSFEIEILEDDIKEGVENFFVRLALPDGVSLPPGYSFSETRTEVGILDEDGAQIGFIETSRQEDELYVSGNPAVSDLVIAIGVELEELSETVELDYVIEDGSATFGADYGSASTLIVNSILTPGASGVTITPGIGPTTGTITLYPGIVQPGSYGIVVPLIDDNLAENDETFTIRLFEPPDGLPSFIELYNDTYEVTIQNDDDVTIGFQETTHRVDEDAGSVEAKIAVLTGSLADNTEVTVRYSTSDDTAIAGQDYTAVSDVLTFTQSNAQQRISIPVINDDIFDGVDPERFVVNIFNVNEPPISGLTEAPAQAEVLIIGDNDIPEIRLLPAVARVKENAGTDRTLRATIPYPLAVDLTVSLARFHDDDDATVNEDFETYKVPDAVAIPAGETEVVIEVPLTDDIDVEVETVLKVAITHFNHEGLTQPYEYPLAGRPSATVRFILDVDTLVLNLELSKTADEGEEYDANVSYSGPFRFSEPPVSRPQILMLEVRVINPDGTPGELYTTSPLSLTDGDTQGTIKLRFNNDFYEGKRAYTLNLLGHPGLDRSIIIDGGSSDITVAENDFPELALNYGGNSEVAEGQGIDVELELTNGGPQGLHEPLTVRLALTETSTASTSDIDFPSTVTIPRGMSSATFRIEARNDMLNGEIEQFELDLVSIVAPVLADGLSGVVFRTGGVVAVAEPPMLVVRIDTQGKTEYLENEDVELKFAFPPGVTVGVPVTVDYRIDFVDADADGNKRNAAEASDITGGTVSGSAVIPANENSVIVTIDLETDSRQEETELFQVSLTSVTSDIPVDFIGTPQIITILDDDAILYRIGLIDSADILNTDTVEEGVAYRFTLTRLGRITSDETVNYEIATARFTGNDPASAADFGGTFPTGNFVFNGYDAVAEISLTPFDDMLLEGTEAFKFSIDGTSNDTGKNYKIRDNEDGTVILATPVKTAYNENENIGLTVKLPSNVNAGAPITVNYDISFPKVGSTAQAESADITTTSREVTIAANVNSVPLTIMLNDDEDPEETELLRVTLTDVSTTNGARVVVGGQSVDLTILDDEDLTYEIEGADEIGEDGGSYTVRLRRKGTITSGAMVAYTVSGGDVSTADFAGNAFPSGNFTFTGYDALSDEVTFTIENDGDSEGAETFQISVNGGTTTTTKSKEVRINDDDATLVTVRRVGSDSGPVAEGGMIMLEATLVEAGGLATENLMVTVAARALVSDPDGGTAADVNLPSPPTVMIAMGTSIATFTVRAENDNDAEYDETVNIYVTHVGMDEIMDDGYDLTIASDDDDKITAALEVLSTSNLDEGGTANVRITLTGRPGSSSSTLPSQTLANALSLVLSDSANYGMDVTIPLTDITPGLESSATADVAIALKDDDLLEALETIELELRIDSTKFIDLADVLDVSSAMTSFELADADMGQVSIATLSDTSFNESEAVEVTVELPSGLTAGTNITVGYELIVTTTDEDDKASAADIDGDVMGREVTIMAGDRTAIIMIDLVDNDAAELTEQLDIRLTSASGATGVSYNSAITNVMILDNEMTEYTLVGDATVVEGVAYTVQLSRKGTIVSDAMVSYTVSDATTGNDVDADDFGGTFPTSNFMFSGDNALSEMVTIATGDDDDLENDETFLITAGGATKDVMIIDDDDASAEVRVGSAGSTVTEGDSAITLEVHLTNAPGGAPDALTIDLAARGTGDPDSGDPADVTINPTRVTITPGERMATFNVSAVDDVVVEYPEKVNIYVAKINDADVATDSGVDLTVTSDDQITVESLRVSDGSEGGMVNAEITLSEALPSRTPANALALVLSDSTNDGLDVTIPTTDITQDLKNNRRVTVPISLLDDDLLEALETIEVELEITSPAMGQPNLASVLDVSVAEAMTSFTLADADSGEVSIVALPKTSYDESEDVTVMVSLPSGLTAGTDITVEYVLSYPTDDGGTLRDAANADDVVGNPVPVTIMAGETRTIFVIDLNDDSIAEETELVGVRLTRASGAAGTKVTPDNSVVQFRILDNEDPAYILEGLETVNESDGSYTVKARRFGRTSVSSVGYTVRGAGGTPALAVDFTAAVGMFPSGTLTFSGIAAVSTDTIQIYDDTLLEDDETFLIVLSAGVADEFSQAIRLVDNDQPTVFVRYPAGVSSITFDEGQSADLVAVLDNAPNGATTDLTVSLAARGVSAVDSGTPADVSIPTTVEIPRGARKVTFAVKAVADGLVEYTETINIYAGDVAYGSDNRDPGDRGSAVAVVSTDQVRPTITIPNGTEGGTIRAQITLDQVLPPRTPDGVLSLVLSDGRTTNDDVEIIYTDLAADLKSGTKTFVTINLKEDTRLEGDETVRVELRIAPGQSPDLADLFPSAVEGSFKIIDNELGMVSIVPPSVSEYYESVGGANSAAETVDFEFKLPNGVIADVPVVVYYSMGLAEIGSGSETAFGPVLAPGFAQGLALPIRGFTQPARLFVTIPVGQNSYILTVTLPDDDKAEVTELLTVSLESVVASAPGARVEVDQQMDETVITILDDEKPVIEIIAERSANEEDGSYKVRARRLGRINTMGEKVRVSIVGDAADAGDFVGELSREVEFSGLNPESSEIVLTLNDDRSQEDARTFQIEVERRNAMGELESVPLVDRAGNSVTEFAVILLDSDVADFFGALPPTGGPVLPVWLLLVLLLTGIALLAPALRRS